MRIDKFLKISRVIKRRTVAADACDGGRIEINGKVAKPSKDVKVGDVVSVSFGNNTMKFEVLSVDEHQTKQSAENMYRLLNWAILCASLLSARHECLNFGATSHTSLFAKPQKNKRTQAMFRNNLVFEISGQNPLKWKINQNCAIEMRAAKECFFRIGAYLLYVTD